MIKGIIVDDELTAIESLTWEINKFCDGIEIIDSFIKPEDAVSAINYLKPDCVFLDIEMPRMDGFQLLKNLTYKEFDLIITTAFDNYALQAFKENAIDYLLKPIDSDDLIRSVNKIKANKQKDNLGKHLKNTLEQLLPKKVSNKVAFHLSGKTVFVNSDEIVYCKSDGNYSKVFLINGETHFLSKKLKDVQILINDQSLFRVHNSYLINLNYIKEFVKIDGQYIVLETGDSIPVSRSKKADLLDALNT